MTVAFYFAICLGKWKKKIFWLSVVIEALFWIWKGVQFSCQPISPGWYAGEPFYLEPVLFCWLELMLNWIDDICRVQLIWDGMVYIGVYSNKIGGKG